MNIGGKLIIAFFFNETKDAIGGMETHAEYFMDYFSKNGMLDCVIYEEYIEQYKGKDIKVINYHSEEELFFYLKNNKINVFFFNNGKWIEEYEEIRRRFPQVKMIMRSGGNEFMKAPLQNMQLGIESRRVIWAESINKIDYIIANSAFSAHRMQSIGIKKEKIVVVRGGVDISKCMEYKEKKKYIHNCICSKYNIDGSNILFGIISRFEEFKGIISTLKVLEMHQDLKWHLIIAGEGREKENIICYLQEHFCQTKYSYLGKLNSKEALYVISGLDFLLNLSIEYERKSGSDTYIHTETMGRSMLEAICCGIPVIATKVGGTSELFWENNSVGYLLKGVNEFEQIIGSILMKKIRVDLTDENVYDWNYIFEKIYVPLMKLAIIKKYSSSIVVDIEGTIIHDFLSENDNKENFLKILEMSKFCNVIINTAGELDDIFKHYSYVRNYIDKIIIIANCGKKVLLYGDHFVFWENYANSLFGPGEKAIKEIANSIERKGYKIVKQNNVDKLYINFKIGNVSNKLVTELNKKLKNTLFEICKNANNLKVISEEINKGNTMRFICNNILSKGYCVGIGNGILDESFLISCDKAYIVNRKTEHKQLEEVSIGNLREMQNFIEEIRYGVTEKENFNCNS